MKKKILFAIAALMIAAAAAFHVQNVAFGEKESYASLESIAVMAEAGNRYFLMDINDDGGIEPNYRDYVGLGPGNGGCCCPGANFCATNLFQCSWSICDPYPWNWGGEPPNFDDWT